MYLTNLGREETWLPGWIVKRTSSVSFLIHGQDGRTFRFHQDHMRPRRGPELTVTGQDFRSHYSKWTIVFQRFGSLQLPSSGHDDKE